MSGGGIIYIDDGGYYREPVADLPPGHSCYACPGWHVSRCCRNQELVDARAEAFSFTTPPKPARGPLRRLRAALRKVDRE
jgi:hypothetical protein